MSNSNKNEKHRCHSISRWKLSDQINKPRILLCHTVTHIQGLLGLRRPRLTVFRGYVAISHKFVKKCNLRRSQWTCMLPVLAPDLYTVYDSTITREPKCSATSITWMWFTVASALQIWNFSPSQHIAAAGGQIAPPFLISCQDSDSETHFHSKHFLICHCRLSRLGCDWALKKLVQMCISSRGTGLGCRAAIRYHLSFIETSWNIFPGLWYSVSCFVSLNCYNRTTAAVGQFRVYERPRRGNKIVHHKPHRKPNRCIDWPAFHCFQFTMLQWIPYTKCHCYRQPTRIMGCICIPHQTCHMSFHYSIPHTEPVAVPVFFLPQSTYIPECFKNPLY